MAEASALPRLGKYEVRGELGRGAMGVVYRAYDRVLEREVALKTLSAPLTDDGQTARFLREARTAGALHHPNIVTIHELGRDNGTHFIVMELMKGTDLDRVVKSRQLPPIDRRLEIVARVCDGLDYAHRAGIVHRDIKPGNVFLGDNGSIKILDFGIAKIAASDATRTGLLIGTVHYMSPEQVRADKNLDGRSDIFSAGVILYELLFGRRPFAADDLGATLHQILHKQPPGYALLDRVLPPELAQVLRRSLDKRREARFATAGEMASALDRIAASLRGRAGTELLERIDELAASGVLNRTESVPESEVVDELETRSSYDSGYGAMAAVQDRTEGRTRPRALSLVAGVLAFAAISTLGIMWLAGNRVERTEVPSTADAPSGAGTVPETTAKRVAEPTEQVGPVFMETVVADPLSPKPETAVADPAPETATPTPAPAGAAPQPAPSIATGVLNVLVMPWARIEWLENLETGERVTINRVTPARLELPAGRYRLHLINPNTEGPLEVEAVVRADRTGEIRRSLPGFDATELAGEILNRSTSPGERR
jgi:serine/threonine protein kinase